MEDLEATPTGADIDEDSALISALNGDTETDEDYDDGQDSDDDETPAPKPESYTVKINGVEKAVSKDELIAHYQKGEAANEKFEEAAAQRRETETQRAGITQHQAQLQEAINHFNAQAQQWQNEGQPDWRDLLENNPHEYLRQQQVWNDRGAKMQQAQSAQAHLNSEVQARQAQESQEHLAKEGAKLTEVLPEWKDAAVRDREAKELSEYLPTLGYSPEDINNLNHSKASNIGLVVKAMRYDKLVSKANGLKQSKGDVAPVKPVSTVSGAATVRKSPDKMNDTEFANWRRSQISKRN